MSKRIRKASATPSQRPKKDTKKKRRNSAPDASAQAAASAPPSGGLHVGVDIGGTKLYAVIANADGKILGSGRKKTRPELGFDGVMNRVAEVVTEACDDADISLHTVASIGVGAPSPMRADGTAVSAPNLGWRDAPVGATLARALDRPIITANDCDAGTLGEFVYGAGAGAQILVGLFMGTGLGGGVVIDGRLVRGEDNLAAEIGHMVVHVDGRRCGCGHRGCLEAYASKTAIAKRVTCAVACDGRETLLTDLCNGDYSHLRSGLLAKAYAAKDDLTVESLHEAARYLGVGIANLITLLGPSVVILGGGVMEALGKKLLPRIKRAAAETAFPPGAAKRTKIRLAALGDDAVALGAVAWARQSLANA
ncbi:MAG: ROK family protein [Deltaproteobacteria bacterium]|nr:ROK family protein [Deltaproteobacteria bacterium]